MKDHLKAPGYRWLDRLDCSDGRPKSLWIEIAEEHSTMSFGICGRNQWEEADPPSKRLTAFGRFKA